MTDDMIKVTDVTLRDGLQNLPHVVPLDRKLVLLDRLLAAGVRSLEVGSFMHPGLVPPMADTDRLYASLPEHQAELIALVANERGARRAVAAGAEHVRLVLSASEGHSRSNTNRTVAEGLAEVARCIEILQDGSRIRATAVLATAFVCPIDGVVPTARLIGVVGELVDMGFDEISLADTLGKASPDQVDERLTAVLSAHTDASFSLHLHNTYGMGMANVMVGLRHGIRHFDAALGGIGGCPFAPGAAGNIATEDLVHLLHASGWGTGIDLDQLAPAATALQGNITSPLESMIPRALGWSIGEPASAS